MLAGAICQHFQSERAQSLREDEIFLYAFFQDPSTSAREHQRKRREALEADLGETSTENTNTAERIVQSLVQQLLQRESFQDKLFPIIERVHRKFAPKPCPLDDLWDLLSTMINSLPAKPIILLDALDECIDPVSFIKNLGTINALIVATSRPEPHIIKEFDLLRNVFPMKMDVAGDIAKFVYDELRKDVRMAEYKDTIISKVTGAQNKDSDGNFLYARLVLNELQECSTGQTM